MDATLPTSPLSFPLNREHHKTLTFHATKQQPTTNSCPPPSSRPLSRPSLVSAIALSLFLSTLPFAVRRRSSPHATNPQNNIKPQKTAIKCPETLAVLAKLVYNTAVMPKEAKYRRVKLGNATVAKTVGASADALKALELLGWRPASVEEGAGAELELPEGVTLTMVQHRLVIAASDALASASLRRTWDKPASANSSGGNLAALAGQQAQQQAQQQP
jgi:hypothetical protein